MEVCCFIRGELDHLARKMEAIMKVVVVVLCVNEVATAVVCQPSATLMQVG